jgi:hypothetical protein
MVAPTPWDRVHGESIRRTGSRLFPAPSRDTAALETGMPANATVTATRLNLRVSPSTANEPIAELRRGTRIRVLDQGGSWYRVDADGTVGWVHADFVHHDSEPTLPGYLCESPELCNAPLEPFAPIPLSRARTQLQKTTALTWNSYGGMLDPMCRAVAVPPAAAVAVLCVESSGRGFANGRMIIRFENHIFWDQWGRSNEDRYREHFTHNNTKRWTGHRFRTAAGEDWHSPHTGQDAEWAAFNFARGLHEMSALRSISMGAAQIMGFNHARIGYDSALEMFDRFNADERFHILGMFDFIRGPRATSPMLEALRGARYEQFATGYNGSGQAAVYGARIRSHAEAFAAIAD